MDIYKFNYNTEEWESIRNLKAPHKERERLFEEYIVRTGTKLTLQEYFNENDWDRANQWRSKNGYHCVGKPNNTIERLAYAEIACDDELLYNYLVKNSPEDLVESRTDWDDMKRHADSLSDFIDSVKEEVARGIIVVLNN